MRALRRGVQRFTAEIFSFILRPPASLAPGWCFAIRGAKPPQASRRATEVYCRPYASERETHQALGAHLAALDTDCLDIRVDITILPPPPEPPPAPSPVPLRSAGAFPARRGAPTADPIAALVAEPSSRGRL